ncbi:hypothetical protein BJ508DRAFT_331223 [Ascobolus immersus RN42]|uniref:Uncharacterized protein n=1 Tax=Ascobolus immersus RN42 TaxID=1160509 RepID=A0A3N4HSU0_ASCIM|nr:hypothetical protein BJ508DRAFT_331223 [Ascobolus immersus RN42]
MAPKLKRKAGSPLGSEPPAPSAPIASTNPPAAPSPPESTAIQSDGEYDPVGYMLEVGVEEPAFNEEGKKKKLNICTICGKDISPEFDGYNKHMRNVHGRPWVCSDKHVMAIRGLDGCPKAPKPAPKGKSQRIQPRGGCYASVSPMSIKGHLRTAVGKKTDVEEARREDRYYTKELSRGVDKWFTIVGPALPPGFVELSLETASKGKYKIRDPAGLRGFIARLRQEKIFRLEKTLNELEKELTEGTFRQARYAVLKEFTRRRKVPMPGHHCWRCAGNETTLTEHGRPGDPAVFNECSFSYYEPLQLHKMVRKCLSCLWIERLNGGPNPLKCVKMGGSVLKYGKTSSQNVEGDEESCYEDDKSDQSDEEVQVEDDDDVGEDDGEGGGDNIDKGDEGDEGDEGKGEEEPDQDGEVDEENTQGDEDEQAGELPDEENGNQEGSVLPVKTSAAEISGPSTGRRLRSGKRF